MSEENLKYKAKKGIYFTFFNQFANSGLQFVVGVIMARLLTPADYGITALPAIFMAIATIFMEAGFSRAMVRKEELKEEDLSTAFLYSVTVGVVCYFMIFIGAPYIADFYSVPVLEPLIRVTALSFLWSPLATPQIIILQRKLDFKTPTIISVLTKTIGAAVGIAMAYMGYGLWSLVIMGMVSSFVETALLWTAVKWKPTTGWSRESFRYLWGYGNKLMLSAILDTTYNNITPIIIGKYYSPADLGIYNRARGYALIPSAQGTSIVQNVTYPVLSKMQDNDEFLASNYRRMLKTATFVIFPIMTMLAALAKPFIVILVTEKWIDSVLLLQILCFSMMWYPVHAINLNLLQVKGRSDWFLKLEVWKKCIGLVVMACTLPFGIIYFVSAGIASSFVSLFLNTYYTGKLINLGFLEQMKDLLPTYGLSILIFIVVLGMNQFVDNLWLQLIFGLSVGTMLYFGLAFMFNFSELQDLKYMIKRKN